MNKEKVYIRIKEIFEENGLAIPDGEDDMLLDLDSLRAIAIIVDIEDSFDIEIPDSYLSDNMLSTFNDYIDLISTLLKV